MQALLLNRRAKEIILDLGEKLFSKSNENDVTNRFGYYLENAGLKGFKHHSLSHTFATRFLALSVDLYTISRLIGHSDMKTSMIYAKINIETLRSVAEKLDKSCYAIVTWRDVDNDGE
jgi:site-specific recombinase XerD